MSRNQIIIILVLFSQFLNAQSFIVEDTVFNSLSEFEDVNSINWSPDSKKLVFSAKTNVSDQFDIFVFNLSDTTLTNVSSSPMDELNPYWFPDGLRLVYDKVVDSTTGLFIVNPFTKTDKPLFNRNIQSMQASFSLDTMLVCFSGFDIIEDKWQIYTYDFIYDNLNQLTNSDFNCHKPVFSPNGKHILYEEMDSSSKSALKMINWYGKPELSIDTIEAYNAYWDSDSWRFNFLSKTSAGEELLSLRYNGQSPIRLISRQLTIKGFTVSPDKHYYAMIIVGANYNSLVIGNLNR